MAADLDNPMGYPESPPAALEILEILRRVYVPKNTKDAKMCLAALNVLRVHVVAPLADSHTVRPPTAESGGKA